MYKVAGGRVVPNNVAKVRVAGSNPVVRSKEKPGQGIDFASVLSDLPIICPSLAHHGSLTLTPPK